MATNGKDVVYVDVDDEITGIIDKVVSAPSKIVALVLPKRATVFQSIVNMKLLKHRADDAKKHLVLITSEAGILPLAGAVGVHVARTLQSKPELPNAPTFSDAMDEIDEDAPLSLPAEDFDAKKEGQRPVGDLARGKGPNSSQMDEDTIELDNTDLPASNAAPGGSGPNVAAMAAGGSAGKSGGKKGKKDKKLKVPNFESFRLKLVVAGLVLVLLIVGWIIANNVLPKATVTIKTDTSNVNSSLTPTLDTAATEVDTDKQVVPAKVEQLQKTYTQQASATGKKNNGNKASGSVTLSVPCSDVTSFPMTIPAGTGLSSSGLTFITQSTAKLDSAGGGGGGCTFSGTATVTAQQGGSQYNIGPSSFTVAGYSDVSGSSSTSMAGGTDDIQTVVQQSDIDSAKQKAEAGIDKNSIKSQLQQTLQGDGEYAIGDSFSSGSPKASTSAQVGDQVDNVTFTETITYTMFGAKKDDLHKLIEANVGQQIDTTKQAIQDDGIDSATITVPNAGTATKVQLSMEVTSVIGPHLDLNKLKEAIVGKKSGDVQSTIKANPGVEKVTVDFSPFWVNHVPKNTNKITFVLEKSSTNSNASSNQ